MTKIALIISLLFAMPLLAQHPTPMRQGVSTDSVYQLTRSAVIPIHFGRFDTTWAEIYRDSTVIYAGNVRRIVINSTGIRTIGTNIPDTLRIGNGAKLDSAYVSSDTLKFRVGSVWYSAYKNNPVDTIAVAGIASKAALRDTAAAIRAILDTTFHASDTSAVNGIASAAALQDTAAALRASIGSGGGGGGTNPTKQQALNTLNTDSPHEITLTKPLSVNKWVKFNGPNSGLVGLGYWGGDSAWVYVYGLTPGANIVATYWSNSLLTGATPLSIGNVQTNGFSIYGDSGKSAYFWIATPERAGIYDGGGGAGGPDLMVSGTNNKDSIVVTYVKQTGDSLVQVDFDVIGYVGDQQGEGEDLTIYATIGAFVGRYALSGTTRLWSWFNPEMNPYLTYAVSSNSSVNSHQTVYYSLDGWGIGDTVRLVVSVWTVIEADEISLWHLNWQVINTEDFF